MDPRPGGGRRPGGQVPRAQPGLSRRLHDPEALYRREHHPPAHGQDAHLHDHDRRDEERVRRPAQRAPALDAPGHPRDPRRPADDPEDDPPGRVRGDGRHLRRRRAGPALHGALHQERDPGLVGPGGDRRDGGQADGLRPDVDQVHPARARARAGLRRPAGDRDGGRPGRGRARTGISAARSRR